MKKTLRKNRRYLVTLILTISMMLSMATNVFAGWETYNSGTVYLEETWVGSKQCINFYTGGQWKRNVAGEGNTLWINSIPVLNNLYSTCYWCFDKYGNTWVINTSQQLLLCKANTTSFVVNNSIVGCTGFQRDSGKVGYLVYTKNGTYSLDDLLNGRNTTYNSGSSYTTNVVSSAPYSYDEIVTKKDNVYKYNYKGEEYCYRILGNRFYCGNAAIEYDVEKFGFSYGYVIYVVKSTPSVVYKLPIGKTSEAKEIGRKFESFNYDNKGWIYSVQLDNKVVNVNSNVSYNNNYNYDDNYNYNRTYPYVQKSGSYYYYYTSANKYYKYYLSGSTLYYKGTNSSSSNTKLATSVDEITFSPEGYIVYSVNDSYDRVYAYPVGKTSSSYRETVGKYFDYFDEEYDDYMSYGYYDRYDDFIDFDF